MVLSSGNIHEEMMNYSEALLHLNVLITNNVRGSSGWHVYQSVLIYCGLNVIVWCMPGG